ncbi:hypothetical protein GGF46_000557 [Coemansia sp. RSA 552]|nr:hypothetical protein GGF46_000557 [Coemansia sp. RSA 552]
MHYFVDCTELTYMPSIVDSIVVGVAMCEVVDQDVVDAADVVVGVVGPANSGTRVESAVRVADEPTTSSPTAGLSWKVLYALPPNARPEVGPSGEKIPGPFSPPLRPLTPERALGSLRKPQDELRRESEALAMKQRVQSLLQQAASSPTGGMGTYVGKLSEHNNPLIPVLPRLDP